MPHEQPQESALAPDEEPQEEQPPQESALAPDESAQAPGDSAQAPGEPAPKPSWDWHQRLDRAAAAGYAVRAVLQGRAAAVPPKPAAPEALRERVYVVVRAADPGHEGIFATGGWSRIRPLVEDARGRGSDRAVWDKWPSIREAEAYFKAATGRQPPRLT